ncbi:MAG: hypothetical protein M0R06_27015 [Sphaerochaeta sp.]|jgi:hypothetical protein|nr:hypothetical protein [Sphaerochaeta sp.]
MNGIDTRKDPRPWSEIAEEVLADTWTTIRAWRYTRRQTIILAGVIVGSLIAVTCLVVATVAVVSIVRMFL